MLGGYVNLKIPVGHARHTFTPAAKALGKGLCEEGGVGTEQLGASQRW